MFSSNVPYRRLRALLLDLGFTERVVDEKYPRPDQHALWMALEVLHLLLEPLRQGNVVAVHAGDGALGPVGENRQPDEDRRRAGRALRVVGQVECRSGVGARLCEVIADLIGRGSEPDAARAEANRPAIYRPSRPSAAQHRCGGVRGKTAAGTAAASHLQNRD